MIWTVVWAPRFERDLLHIPWQSAARVARAVLRFAATGEGDIRRGQLANERRLYVGTYCVHVLVDAQARTVTAETAYRLR